MPTSTVHDRRREAKFDNHDVDKRTHIRVTQPVRPIDWPAHQAASEFYDRVASQRTQDEQRNWYYYDLLTHYLRFIIPAGQRILEIGCGDGHLLRRLRPEYGLGIDFSANMINKARAEARPNENIQFEQANIATAQFK